ncbi:MAG: hypothetical protein HOH13_11120 [Crocinitomicaceae bacterium]|nr:hypothetical protein [Crocinitomicaceae bacterium]
MSVQKFKEEMPEGLYEKVKVQTLTIFCFAIVMIFAGFISAYIVQSSDKVWVKLSPPEAFLFSTVCVLITSAFLIIALFILKKGSTKWVTRFLGLALISGLGFCYYQYKGWGELISGGNLVSVHIVNSIGQYDSKFHFEKDGQRIDHDGQNYFISGEKMEPNEVIKLRQFAHDICENQYRLTNQVISLEENWDPFTIVSSANNAVQFGDTSISWQNDSILNYSAKQDLFNFALAVHLKMEYFKLTGTYGTDFTLLLNQEELEFDNRRFYYKELILTEEEILGVEGSDFDEGKEIKIKDGILYADDGEIIDVSNGHWDFDYRAGKVDFSIVIDNGVWTRLRSEISGDDYAAIKNRGNTASSYLWVVSIVHFLHIIGGIIYLLSLFILALNKQIVSYNKVKIRLANIYWHVLGGLWVFLFLFFQYYH